MNKIYNVLNFFLFMCVIFLINQNFTIKREIELGHELRRAMLEEIQKGQHLREQIYKETKQGAMLRKEILSEIQQGAAMRAEILQTQQALKELINERK